MRTGVLLIAPGHGTVMALYSYAYQPCGSFEPGLNREPIIRSALHCLEYTRMFACARGLLDGGFKLISNTLFCRLSTCRHDLSLVCPCVVQVVFDPIIMLSNAAAAFGLNMSVFLLIGKVRPRICPWARDCPPCDPALTLPSFKP